MNVVVNALYQPLPRLLRVWDRVSIYLPLLLMGALVLGTYWLVRNSPVLGTPQGSKTIKHEVDYFMRQFTIKSFDDAGLLKSEVNGTEARHYIDTDILEIDQPRMRSIGEQGRLIISTGNLALSNGDGSEVQLLGNARVVREAIQNANGAMLLRMEFAGEFLHAFVNEERVSSHKPVVLTRGGDQFTGDTLTYNNVTGIAELKGRVKGVLMPKMRAKSTSTAAAKGLP